MLDRPYLTEREGDLLLLHDDIFDFLTLRVEKPIDLALNVLLRQRARAHAHLRSRPRSHDEFVAGAQGVRVLTQYM